MTIAIDIHGAAHVPRYLETDGEDGYNWRNGWFLDVQADPNVAVQIKGELLVARARVPMPEEKPGMWATMTEAWPGCDEYQGKTSRQISVVVLERA
ncbi:MAG: nitroreductase/quinone reductase family protein [Streptosporangiaceae bacterium]|jgi:deazaflavin-dependent oxidoreductase (nitroreductase family)